ncbi:MAG: peptidase M14, partial [Acidobacteriota bacterium]
YAFVIPRAQQDGPTAMKLAQILLDGAVEVNRAGAPFTAAGKTYEAGSLVVLMAQPYRGYAKDLLEPQHHPDRRDGANGPPKRPYDMAGWTLPYQMGVQVDAIDAPFQAALEPITEMPPPAAPASADRRQNGSATAVYRDLESRGKAPRIGVYQSWVASADEGWTRFVLEEYHLPYVSLKDQAVRAGNLRAQVDAIILPDQSLKDIVEGHAPGTMPEEYVGGIGEAGVEALKQFVEEGGTLVAFDGATDLPIRHFGIPVKNAVEGIPNTQFYCPGSLLRMHIDQRSHIATGMPGEQAAFFVNGRAFLIEGNAAEPVASYAQQDLLMSGWINGEQYIAGKAAVVNAPLGKGRIVLFGFSPIFRGQPYGTFKLLFNALLEASATRDASGVNREDPEGHKAARK